MPRCSRRTKEERGGENNREVSKVVGRNYATNIVRCLIDLESLQIASSSPLVSPSLPPPLLNPVHETRVVKVHEAVDRSSRTAVDPIEIRAQKRRSDFSDVKRDCLCHIFEKDGKTRSSIGCLRARYDEFLKLIYDS